MPPHRRIAMLTNGTRGDAQPMLALAAHLQREHKMELLVVTTEDSTEFAELLGLQAGAVHVLLVLAYLI